MKLSNTFRGHGVSLEGQNITDYKEAIRLCNLDWKVCKRDLQTVQEIDGEHLGVPNHAGVYREDNHRNIGVVGQTYELVQNDESILFIEDLIEKGLDFKIEYGGEILWGERLFLTLTVGSPMVVGTEAFKKMIVISWGHNGSIGMSAKFMLVRGRTSSLVNLEVPGTKSFVNFKHTKNVRARMQMASKIMSQSAEYFNLVRDKMTMMQGLTLLDDEFKGVLETIIPDGSTDRSAKMAKKNRSEIMSLFKFGNGAKELGSTKLNGFMAVSEYCNDKRTRVKNDGRSKAEVEVNGFLFGNRSKEAVKAFEELLATA